MPLLDEIDSLCTSLRNNATTTRRKAIKDILEITEKESHRTAISGMGTG